MHNIPDDCAANPLAPWNEKRQHPGDVFAMAKRGDSDARNFIYDHWRTWGSDELLAMCARELQIVYGSENCKKVIGYDWEILTDQMSDNWPSLLVNSGDWFSELLRSAVGDSIRDNWPSRSIADLLVAVMYSGKRSPEFPGANFDFWADQCQRDWEDEA